MIGYVYIRARMNRWLIFRAARWVCIRAVSSGTAALKQGAQDRATDGINQLEASSRAFSSLCRQLTIRAGCEINSYFQHVVACLVYIVSPPQ